MKNHEPLQCVRVCEYLRHSLSFVNCKLSQQTADQWLKLVNHVICLRAVECRPRLYLRLHSSLNKIHDYYRQEKDVVMSYKNFLNTVYVWNENTGINRNSVVYQLPSKQFQNYTGDIISY